MNNPFWIPLVCLALGFGPSSLPAAEPGPTWISWVEPAKPAGLQAYPLFSFKAGVATDISFDPGEGKTAPASLPVASYPWVAKPVVEAWHWGRSLGTLAITGFQPVPVSCNELVLAQLKWTDPAQAARLGRAGQGFVAGCGLPRQGNWSSELPAARRAELEAQFLATGLRRFGLVEGSKPKAFVKHWLRLGPDRGEVAFLQLELRVGKKQRVLNAVVQPAGDGSLKTLWEVTGEQPVDSDMGVPVYELLDAVDIDGDGVPELLFGYHNYEANAFVLVRILPGKAAVLWSGSDYGC